MRPHPSERRALTSQSRLCVTETRKEFSRRECGIIARSLLKTHVAKNMRSICLSSPRMRCNLRLPLSQEREAADTKGIKAEGLKRCDRETKELMRDCDLLACENTKDTTDQLGR